MRERNGGEREKKENGVEPHQFKLVPLRVMVKRALVWFLVCSRRRGQTHTDTHLLGG